MTTEDNGRRNERNASNESNIPSRRLIVWPLALIGLTLASILVANAVSAWGGHGSYEAEDIKSHTDRFLDRALDRLDATEEQSAAIRAIVESTIDELHAVGSGLASGHDDFRNLLMADSIDRAALEDLRRSHMERADELTRILTGNLADVIELLTPQQREELEGHLEKHRGRGHGHSGHRGHRGHWGRGRH